MGFERCHNLGKAGNVVNEIEFAARREQSCRARRNLGKRNFFFEAGNALALRAPLPALLYGGLHTTASKCPVNSCMGTFAISMFNPFMREFSLKSSQQAD